MRVVRSLLIGVVSLAACAEGMSDAEHTHDPGSIAPFDDEGTENTDELRWRPRVDAGRVVDTGRSDAGSVVVVDAGRAPGDSDAGRFEDAGSIPGDPENPQIDAGSAQADAGSATADVGRSDAGAPRDAGRADAGSGGQADSGATPSNDAGSARAVWRPFNDASPWNTLIPANPPLAPDSAALISDLRTSSQYGQNLDINIAQFSVPIYWATSSSPLVEFVVELGGLGFSGSNGSNARATVPIPSGAAPDPYADGHLLIIDRAKNIEWGFYLAKNQNGRWTAALGATADLLGDGLKPYKPSNATWYTSHGPRACGFPLAAGLIRTEEIEAGRIEHALIIAYPHIRAGYYMSPASTAQARIGDESIKSRGIPCGGHVQLDPSLNLDNLGLSRGGRVVAEALQRYGAFVGDYSGAISIYAENSPAAQQAWKGVLQTYEFQNKLDLSRLRVLQFGTLTDDGNGN